MQLTFIVCRVLLLLQTFSPDLITVCPENQPHCGCWHALRKIFPRLIFDHQQAIAYTLSYNREHLEVLSIIGCLVTAAVTAAFSHPTLQIHHLLR